MSGLQNVTLLFGMCPDPPFKGKITHGSVGIEQISCFPVNTGDGIRSFRIGDAFTVQLSGERLSVSEDFQNAYKVARVRHIHGIGNGGYGRIRSIVAIIQKSGYGVIGITGRNEMGDGQP